MRPALLAIIIFMFTTSVARLQQNEPIYLQYDGWLKNADGSYTLSFGYFNYNSVEVTIAPWGNNTFTAGDPDRNQPSTFQPGRNRNACVMVIDAKVDVRLQWTLNHGGKESTTTSKLLDPLYELDEGMV